jgi:quercetin dioxygenase-like cupin family protein
VLSVDAPCKAASVVSALGAVAGVAAWLGWLTVSPALGFPSLGPGAMFNRLLVPREDPGFWLGWALLVIGLASAALLYLAAAGRGRFQASIASGLLYGATCWLLAGAVVMPLLGLAVPAPAAAAGALIPPDPMQGSFMMLHLGLGAPIAALVAWLTFGGVLGATAGTRASDPGTSRRLALGAAVGLVTFFAVAVVGFGLKAPLAGASATTTQTLATEGAQSLQKGADYFSILELSQVPGATLGPHVHPYSGFAYSLQGVATVSLPTGTIRVGPDQAGLIGQQAVHSHSNGEDRLPTAILALLLVALAGLACWIWLQPAQRGRLLSIALVGVIALGAIATVDPWSNDWLFLSIRSVSNRGAPMPLPTASRRYESPDINGLPPGPYMQTLEELAVAPGAAPMDVGSVGASLLFVRDGSIRAAVTGGSVVLIGAYGATLVQPGQSVEVTNAGDGVAHVLEYSVMPVAQGS